MMIWPEELLHKRQNDQADKVSTKLCHKITKPKKQ